MKYKKCRRCKKFKTEDNFVASGHKRKDGGIIKDTLCKPCKVIYNRAKRHKARSWIHGYKENLSCVKCGYSKKTHPNFTSSALQFHHPQNNKSFSVGDGGHKGYSIKRIQKEIEKCVVLCCRCHAEIHYN